jgi:hypothetical protein
MMTRARDIPRYRNRTSPRVSKIDEHESRVYSDSQKTLHKIMAHKMNALLSRRFPLGGLHDAAILSRIKAKP